MKHLLLIISLVLAAVSLQAMMGHANYKIPRDIQTNYINHNRVVIKFKGDVNRDGEVNISDVNAVINIILGGIADNNGDVNDDGEINIGDINAVIDIIYGGGIDAEMFTVNGVSFTMVSVSGGTFMMGATIEQGDDVQSNEKPAHQVTLSDYYIGQTEVTQELWQAVMSNNPSNFTGNLQHPVEKVNWEECQEFIAKLNTLTGKVFRLPTEAEWEFAARGGNKSNGYKYAGSNNIDNVAWYANNSSNVTHAVAKKASNELGLYDMSGNVFEWCQDWYDSYSNIEQVDPIGPDSGAFRVVRGGCYEVDLGLGKYCRVSYRNFSKSDYRSEIIGLRLALSLDDTAVPVITTQIDDNTVTITASGDGTVKLYHNGQLVANPYIIYRGETDYTISVYATAQEDGKNMSQSETMDITIPALEHTAIPVISTQTNEYSVTITAVGDGTVTLFVNGEAVSNPYIASRSNSAYTITAYATAKESGKVLSQSETMTINVPALVYSAVPVITTQTSETAVTVTATGSGTVKLYVNGQQVSNPYTAERGNSDYTITTYATAKEDGKLMSQSEPKTITVPALTINPSANSFIVNGVTFKMVTVDGGTFLMGATPEQGENVRDNEKPVHEVMLSSYLIGQTEVTQELWLAVMGTNPSYHTGDLQRPVDMVSWVDCQEFISRLNQLTGKTFRLPTEAEWEFAARGGNKSQGYRYAGSDDMLAVAWCENNSENSTHPVGTKASNELGLYDMTGNVWEWCNDWYKLYSDEAQVNPTGPETGNNRVLRGGCWNGDFIYNRISYRDNFIPTGRNSSGGLRLVLDIPEVYTVNGVSFTMIPVDGGTFLMGATPEQGENVVGWERPVHEVTLSSYCIGETEVTQELWLAVMGTNPSYITGDLQRPVENVTWNDCQEFITLLNALTGCNFRLPTEAEWEFAARGGNRSRGYKYAGSDNIDDVGWYSGNIPAESIGPDGLGTTQRVATKAPNELYIYDMSGNAEEWTNDYWSFYTSGSQTNPTGPETGTTRVYRGGSWYESETTCRVSFRMHRAETFHRSTMGLRLAL